ncbi:helix-turn-helix transcriptional regulator [Amaricoccus tamworthensis]|uniref:helix-turn-helix transcriptional regulator n=1 Tax=Amaricoccus tamworthensis TaxID=57002 RepID=UPI003C7E0410
MYDTPSENLHGLHHGMPLDQAMDLVRDALAPAGFNVFTYDYSPVPLSHDGGFILPTVFDMRNAPDDMEGLWCSEGYYGWDPVMEASRHVTCPFTWSHRGRQSAIMDKIMSKRHRPVVDYLCDTGMDCGITVPIPNPDGALATFTAICRDPMDKSGIDRHLSSVGHLAHMLHDAIHPGFKPHELRTPHVQLTPRETQCLRLCAHGMTTKEIAWELSRSIPTVTLHLTSATKKLGARNRNHAVTLAAHYRLLNPNA